MGEDDLILTDDSSSTINKNIATPELVFDWRKFYLKEGHSVASTTTYFNYIKGYVGYGIEVNQKTVDRFRNKSSSGVSSGALKSFFNFLVRKKDFPMEILHIYFDKSKSKKRFPEALEFEEVQKIINAMESLKDRYFTIVMANLGCRISECLKLKFEDFLWSTWLKDRTQRGAVNLKNTKGGKFRTIPVSSEIMEMLYSDSVNPNKTPDGIPIGGLVFDYGIMDFATRKDKTLEENQWDYIKSAGDRYRSVLDKVAKNTLNKKIHPHQFRHFQAQNLLNNGLDIVHLKLFLGHSKISSTEIYAHSSAELLKKEIEKLNINNVKDKPKENNPS
jgi:integrase